VQHAPRSRHGLLFPGSVEFCGLYRHDDRRFSRGSYGRFGALPYGTDLSPEELRLGAALRGLKARSETLAGKLAIGAALLKPLPRDAESRALFERMGVAAPRGMLERWMRRQIAAAL